MRPIVAILFVFLLSSMALAARCPRACRMRLASEVTTCRAICPTRRPGKACRSACVGEFTTSKRTCKAATHPVPPSCGATTTTITPPCTFVLKWGMDDGGLSGGPLSVATDASGHVYVADTGNARIQKFECS